MELPRFIPFWVHSTSLKLHFLSSITGCDSIHWYADGICDDENNNEACFFDGGDCCGPNVNTDYCTVCQCLSEGGSSGGNGGIATTTPSLTTNNGGCANQAWVGDGYCDDGNNNQECNFDGGDCCGDDVNIDYCSECLCLEWRYT